MAKVLRKADLENVLQYAKVLGTLSPDRKYSLKQIAKIIQGKDQNFCYKSIDSILSTLKNVNDRLHLLDKCSPIATDGRGCATAYWYMRTKSQEDMEGIIATYNSQYYTPLDDKRFLTPKARSLEEFE